MIKKLFSLLLACLALAPLLSCTGGETPEGGTPSDAFSMKATITNIGERIEVDVTEAEYAEGPYWVITSDATVYLDRDGNAIARSDLKVGDTIEIFYSGQVMMSYPPQIVAARIRCASWRR